MSLRKVSPPPASSPAEPDLDTTAELPVLDAAGAAAADEPHSTTDTWAAPPVAAAAPAAGGERGEAARALELEANLQSVSAELSSVTTKFSEAQELLRSKGERVTLLERTRDETNATLAAAEQRAADLEQRLTALGAELAQRQTP